MRQPDPSPREAEGGRQSPQLGDVIAGKYRLENILGSGAAGVVRAATRLASGDRVAIKLLRPSASLDPAERDLCTARFIREAELAVRIKSEHVTRILDTGTLPSGVPYIVMELLDGVDLQRLVRDRGALPPGEAVAYVLQACEAIGEAHALGIVHRDLKPANLFAARRADGSVRVKVLDFGISKLVTGVLRDGDSTLTGKTDVLGSPQFMAPEQIRNPVDVDGRSDIWSLGAVLYRLLTDRCAFEGDDAAEVLLAVISVDPIPPRALSPAIPPDLEALVLRCLAKDRTQRPADIDELARALHPFASPLPRATPVAVAKLPLEAIPPQPAFLAPPAQLNSAARPSEIALATAARQRRLAAIVLAALCATILLLAAIYRATR